MGSKYLEKPDPRKWRELSLDEAGLAAADVPSKYLVAAEKRIALLLCSEPFYPLDLLRKDACRGQSHVFPAAFDVALRAHAVGGRVKILSKLVTVAITDEDGDTN